MLLFCGVTTLLRFSEVLRFASGLAALTRDMLEHVGYSLAAGAGFHTGLLVFFIDRSDCMVCVSLLSD